MWYLELRDFQYGLRRIEDLDEYEAECGDDTTTGHSLYRIPGRLQGLVEAITTLDKAHPDCKIDCLLDELVGHIFECGSGINVPVFTSEKTTR